MGFLDKVFNKEKKEEAVVETPPCPHSVLVPRWDSIDDMGKEEKATHFVCEACQETFSPEDASRLRASEAARLSEITSEAPAEARTEA
jgi:transposase-like protein